ncbi:hypothetical protein, partial [Klebsiella michiganensis]
LKDRTAIVEVGGKLIRFLSVPTYKDTHGDRDIWTPITAESDREFLIAKLAESRALDQRAINRVGAFA